MSAHLKTAGKTLVALLLAAVLFHAVVHRTVAAAEQKEEFRIDSLPGRLTIAVRQSAKIKSERWRLTDGKTVEIEVPRDTHVVKVEDLRADGVLEIWTVGTNPDDDGLFLQQLDLRYISKYKVNVWQLSLGKPVLEVTVSPRNPLASIHWIDLDGDGNRELVIDSPTHSAFGVPHGPGQVRWTDVYVLDPHPRLVNARYKKHFEAKRLEINGEITKLERKIADSFSREIEAEEQVKVYKEWLRRIAAIIGDR